MKQSHHPTEPADPRLQLTNEGLLWLMAALLLGAVGWWKSINLVLLLAYLMAVLLVINGLLARVQVRRVTVSREPTPPVFAGEEATLRVNVANTGSRPATVSVESRVGDDATGWLVLKLSPGTAVFCTTRRGFPLRGVFPTPPARVSSSFPLALLRCEGYSGGRNELFVLPALGGIDTAGLRRWVFMQAGGDGRARKVLRRVTTDQADVRGVRPYRPGDAIRSIHWRTSARRGELMVREYDAAPSPDLIVVVEPWLPVDPSAVHRGNLEAALSLAATIAQTWIQVYGTRVTVAVAGDPASVRTTTATDKGLREALAPLAGVVGDSRFDPLPVRVLGRGIARATRLVVSSRAGSPYAAALSRATGRVFVNLAPADRPRWYHPPGQWTAGKKQRVGTG